MFIPEGLYTYSTMYGFKQCIALLLVMSVSVSNVFTLLGKVNFDIMTIKNILDGQTVI